VDNRSRQRYISLQTIITIGMAAMGIVASAIITGIYYLNFSNQAREDIKLRLRNIADITAVQLKPEELVHLGVNKYLVRRPVLYLGKST
jgi:sensor histidine kinase regulating citrate/malate metabolism